VVPGVRSEPARSTPGPRDLLLAERARTQELLAHLREDFDGVVDASRDTNADDEHDPEGQTIAYERSRTGALLRQAERHLTEVASALVRMDDGSYGVCESCGQPIAPGRLEARPTARTCVACVPPTKGSG
jgi:DnaK suppressor protein